MSGNTIEGPALIDEHASTTVIGPRDRLEVNGYGHLVIEVQTMSNTDPTDPITTEIIRSAFVAITDEMKTNLMRTAHNPVIYEALDYTVGLFDATGDTLSIGLGLPSFIGGLANSIRAKLAFYGADGIDPGDILLTNDPYIMGSHLNHLVFTQPIFDAQGTSWWRSHRRWRTGRTSAARLPERRRISTRKACNSRSARFSRKGKQDPEITNIIKANVRLPDSAMGDFFAQVAAVKTGERRFFALLQKYGTEQIRSAMRQIMDQSEAQARRVVASFPDGVYEAESFMDDDGVTLGKPIPLRVKVIIEGDQMTVDLSNISPQVAGYYNAGASAGRSCAQVAFKCLTSPKLLPDQRRLVSRAQDRASAGPGRFGRETRGRPLVDDNSDDHRGYHLPRTGIQNPRPRDRRSPC